MKETKKLQILAQGALEGVYAAGSPSRGGKTYKSLAPYREQLRKAREHKKKRVAYYKSAAGLAATGDTKKRDLEYCNTVIRSIQKQIEVLKRQGYK